MGTRFDIKVSHKGVMVHINHFSFKTPKHTHAMLHKIAIFRGFVIFTCLVAGVLEFFALQRVRLQSRLTHF